MTYQISPKSMTKLSICRGLLGTLILTSCVACGEQSTGAGDSTPAAIARQDANDSRASAVTPAAAAGERAGQSRQAFFGETHLHTAYSLDAYIAGTRLTPADAYRYARGDEIEVLGQRYQIRRPLDFVAVTDHAEYLGEMYSTLVTDAPGHDPPLLAELRGLSDLDEKRRWFLEYVVKNNRGATPAHPSFFAGPETVAGAWQVAVEAAQTHNEPGVFTAFIAFEWSGAPQGANLHRNVIFRDANVPQAPVSYIDINREDGLWKWMAELETLGIRSLAIPHNSNASKGLMFASSNASGDPVDREYAQRRAYFEPLVEMMQIKGNSEVHPRFWAADEFADFENADSLEKFSGRTLQKQNFVRHALIQGLAYQQSLGVNPFKLGFAGGTDNHNGLPADVEEDDWPGGHGPEDGSVERRRDGGVGGWADGKDLNPGALTGVWAEENSREAIWDAMKRRETFATSGTRIRVRFFGGNRLPDNPADADDLVRDGYARGVSMGGTLPATDQAPNFTVHALKDPEGANLDRIQIIKGWLDEAGNLREKIVDIVWAGDRNLDEEGRLPPVGNTVDLTTAGYTNDIGSPQLLGSWTDDAFDARQHALYYVRVLEIPTPRWSTYDAVRAGLPLLDSAPATVQERAWTSPIWYTPR